MHCCIHGSAYNKVVARSLRKCTCCNSDYNISNEDTTGLCIECRGDAKVQKKILNTRLKLEEKIAGINSQLEQLKLKCTHPRVFRIERRNTGNWSKSDDCYWTEFTCPDCLDSWSVRY